MVEQQELVDTVAHHFDWPRLGVIAVGTVAAIALFIWGTLALTKDKCRLTQGTAMPRTYPLPVCTSSDFSTKRVFVLIFTA